MKKLDMNMYKEIGSALKKRRLEKHMSLDQLVHEINHTKTKSTIKRYEDGVTRIDYDTLVLICHVLELNPDNLIVAPKNTISDKEVIELFSKHFNINQQLLSNLTQLNAVDLVRVTNYVQTITDSSNKNYTARFKELLK